MANLLPTTMALFVTLVIIYLESNKPFSLWLLAFFMGNTSASQIIITMCTFLLLLDKALLPNRYRLRIPYICSLIIDYLMAQIAMAAMLYAWTVLHSMLDTLLRELLLREDGKGSIYDETNGVIFLDRFMTATSILTFGYTFKVTDLKTRLKATALKGLDVIVDIGLKIFDYDDSDEFNVIPSK